MRQQQSNQYNKPSTNIQSQGKRTVKQTHLTCQLLELLLEMEVLLLCCANALPELAVYMLLEAFHLDALDLRTLELLTDFDMILCEILKVLCEDLVLQGFQTDLFITLQLLSLVLPLDFHDLLVPFLNLPQVCLLLLCDLVAKCVLFLQHIINDLLDSLLVIKRPKIIFFLQLISFSFSQQSYLIFQFISFLFLLNQPFRILLASLFNLLLALGSFLRYFLASSEYDPCFLFQISRLVFLIFKETIKVSMGHVEIILKMICLLLQSDRIILQIFFFCPDDFVLIVFLSDHIVQSVYLFGNSLEIFFVILNRVVSFYILPQAFCELIHSKLLHIHNVLQLLQYPYQLLILPFNLRILAKNTLNIILQLSYLRSNPKQIASAPTASTTTILLASISNRLCKDPPSGQLGRCIGQFRVCALWVIHEILQQLAYTINHHSLIKNW